MQEIEANATVFDEIVVEQERMSRLHSDRPDRLTRQAISRSAIVIEKESMYKSLVSYADIVGGEVEDVPVHDQFDRSQGEGELENGSWKSSDSEEGNLTL